MRICLIRHATLVVEYNGRKLLVDPMLSDAGAQRPIDNSPNPRHHPLGPLPISATERVDGIDALLVRHAHRDYWDGPQLN